VRILLVKKLLKRAGPAQLAAMLIAVALGTALVACQASEETVQVAQSTAVPTAVPVAVESESSTQATTIGIGGGIRPVMTRELIEGMTEMTMEDVAKYFPRKYPAEFEYEDIKRGGTFRMAATWDLSKWDPRMTAAGGTMTVSNMVYMTMTMFEVGPDADPLTPPIVPRLAETWEFNDDATQLTYHLHQGMHWGDIDDPTQPGPEIVAEDIAWVFDQYKTNSVHSGAFVSVDSVETPDKYTVVVNFTQPSFWFLPTMSIKDQPIFNPHLFKADRQDHEAVGPGPFMLTKAVKSVKVEMKANPNFYFKDERGGKLPYMDAVQFLVVTDASTRVALVRTERVESSYSAVNGTLIAARALLRTNPDLALQAIEGTSVTSVTFQQNDPMWGGVENADARHAISLAVDSRGIGDVLFAGMHAPLPVRVPYYYFMDHQPTWDDMDMLTEEWYGRNLWQYDPEKAKELWDATGYGEVSEALEYYAYTTNLTDYLGQVASDLTKNLGMEVKLNSLDYSSFNGPLAARKHKGIFWEWAASFPELGGQVYQRWNNNGSVNREDLNDPVLNEVSAKMLVATDNDVMVALAKESMLRYGEMAYGFEALLSPSVQVGGYPLQSWVKGFRYGTYSGGYYYYGQLLQTVWLDDHKSVKGR